MSPFTMEMAEAVKVARRFRAGKIRVHNRVQGRPKALRSQSISSDRA